VCTHDCTYFGQMPWSIITRTYNWSFKKLFVKVLLFYISVSSGTILHADHSNCKHCTRDAVLSCCGFKWHFWKIPVVLSILCVLGWNPISFMKYHLTILHILKAGWVVQCKKSNFLPHVLGIHSRVELLYIQEVLTMILIT
jgi:hypothetical protein